MIPDNDERERERERERESIYLFFSDSRIKANQKQDATAAAYIVLIKDIKEYANEQKQNTHIYSCEWVHVI